MRRAALAALLLLGACGFQPLYGQRGPGGGTVPQMAAIAIADDDDRLSQILRNELRDRLTPRGRPEAPRYRLQLSTYEVQSPVLVTRTETITRNNLQVLVQYRLVDLDSRELLLAGSTISLVPYNILRADFATLAAEQDARARAARDAAEQIRTRLAVYFSRAGGGAE